MSNRQKDLSKLLLSSNIAWAMTVFVILCMFTLIAPRNATACLYKGWWNGLSSLKPVDSDYLRNGDFEIFVITDWGDHRPVGDGIDETTIWSIASRQNVDVSTPLSAAILELTLTPKDIQINTDIIRLEGLGDIVTPIIQKLPVNETSFIWLDLLSFYDSRQILEWYNSSPNPRIIYRDDAIVSYSNLRISDTIPEPTTMLLLGSGLLGLAGYGRKKFFKK